MPTDAEYIQALVDAAIAAADPDDDEIVVYIPDGIYVIEAVRHDQGI